MQQTIDLTQIDQELESYDIFDVKYVEGKLVIITQKGEILYL